MSAHVRLLSYLACMAAKRPRNRQNALCPVQALSQKQATTAKRREGEKAMQDIETDIYTGPVAAPFAVNFWNSLDCRTQRHILWDVAFEERPGILQQCWFQADHVVLSFCGRHVVMAAWAKRIGPCSACAAIHFCFARSARKQAHGIGRKALGLFARQCLQSLIGLIPASFGHALAYARRLGFASASQNLADACVVNGRLAPGIFVTCNLNKALDKADARRPPAQE